MLRNRGTKYIFKECTLNLIQPHKIVDVNLYHAEATNSYVEIYVMGGLIRSDSGWHDRPNKLLLGYVLNDSNTILRSGL